ncbi:hypothetical protein EJB05_46091, partial [Eragrostis curvula]
MLKSTAYERMRAEHPAEFAPASVFFTHDARSAIDRRNSFRVKAALVYEAITGHHVDDHMLRANRLLLALAKACHSAIHGKSEEKKTETETEDKSKQKVEGAAEPGTGGPKEKTQQKEEKAELTDEVWDEEHKRVVDGIFLVVGFLPRLMEAITTSSDRDGVDESFKSRHMHDIVTDVIKLENQLPLKVLRDVAGVVQDVIRKTLELNDFNDVKESIPGGEYKLPFITKGSFDDVVHGFCWYYSPFATKKPRPPAPAPADKGPAKAAAAAATDDDYKTLLDCLHQSVAPPPPAPGARATGRPSRMPAARELRRVGVRIQAAENGRAEIEFKEQWAALRLPALVYDFKLATVARNLLAREYEAQSKPVTRYFQMMNELVEDVADVRLLRRAGAVRGASGGDQEVHGLIKNIDGHATYPSVYMAMDREIEKVKQHHDKRMKNFFVRNRPGVILASSVAAISVVAIVAARKVRG